MIAAPVAPEPLVPPDEQLGPPLVARLPILDEKGRVFAYALRYRHHDGAVDGPESNDLACARVVSECAHTHLAGATDGRPVFVRITRPLLLSDVASLMPPAALVVELNVSGPIDDPLVDACRHLTDRGYAIGMDAAAFLQSEERLRPFVRFVTVDLASGRLADLPGLVQASSKRGIRVVALNVETPAMAATAQSAGCRLFSGAYFCQPAMLDRSPIPQHHLAALRLLGALHKPDLPMAELESLVKQDLRLSYHVLRSVNSPAFALRREVSSIRHALVLLGQDQIKKWASVWLLSRLGPQVQSAALAVGLIRGHMCESLSDVLADSTDQAGCFLMGLCSVLDAVMRRPIAEAIADLPLAPGIRQALLGQPVPMRTLLDMVGAYQRADWPAATSGARSLGLPEGRLTKAYLDALWWADVLDGSEAC